MLHFAVTGEHITVSVFSYQRAPSSSASASSGEVKKENLPRRAEQALFNHIREGNLNYKAALSNASTVSSGIQIDIGDPLRRAKNSGDFCSDSQLYVLY